MLYGQGELLGVDEGSLYNMDNTKQSKTPNWKARSSWGSHSLVHNTITVDEKDQQFAGGHRVYYHGAPGEYQAVAAYTDNAYTGVTLERNILLLGGVVVMVDRCLSDTRHTYDWTYHSFGDLTEPTGLSAVKALGPVVPYTLPVNPKKGFPTEPATFTWARSKASLNLTVLAEAGITTEYAAATGWANEAYQLSRLDAPMVMVRREGANARFVTVLEPFKGTTPSITAITKIPVTSGGKPVPDDEAVGLQITKGAQTLTYLFSFTPGQKQCGPIDSVERLMAVAQP